MSYKTKQNQRERGAKFLARNLLCSVSVVATVVALGVPSRVRAQDRHWDGNQTTPGTGGSGEWSVTAPNWSPSDDGVSGPYTVWDNAAIDNAIFEGMAGTVTLTSPITVHNLTFDTDGYTLNGGALTLAGTTPTITTNGSLTTINSVIAGSSGLTKAGGGQLILSGINTFTGNIAVNAGTLNVSGDAALGATANRLVMANGSGLTSTGALDTNRAVELSSGLVVLNGAGIGSAYFTGAGGIRAGNGVALTNDANDFTGNATFLVNGSASFTSVGNIGEASSLGAGDVIRFVGQNQFFDRLFYTGNGDSSNRSWEFAISGGTSGTGLHNDGTGTLTLTGDIVLDITGSRNMLFGADTADLDLLGTISGTAAAVTFRGTGASRSITLGGTNSYSGTTDIDAVTVKAGVLADTGIASSFGNGVAGGITITNGGVFSYTGTGSSSNRDWTIAADGSLLNDGGGALTLSGAVDLGTVANNSLTLGGSFAGENTLSGVISGTGDLISNGAGTWVLSGANTRTGAIIVEDGTLRADNAAAFGTTTGIIVNGGTLDLGGFDLISHRLEGTGGAIALGAATLTVDTAVDTSYAGGIAGSGGLVKSGLGTLTLSGTNTYTGATSLNGGGLTLDFSAAGAPTSDIIAAASTLNMAGGRLDIIGADGTPNSQSFNGLNVTAGSNRIAATSGAGGTTTINFGTITRTGGLVDFALPASGAFTTTSSVLGGWATVNGTDYAKVDGGNILAFTAADYSNKDDAADWLTGEVISDVGGAADTPFFGAVTGSQALGGLKYTAAADSTVTIGAGQTLGIDGTIIVASSVGTANQTISGGSLTGGVGGGALGVLQNGEGLFRIESTVVDNGGATGFTKGGDGDVSLVALNSYTGVTTLSGGTLRINRLANSGQASSIGAASADASNLVLESGTLSYLGATDTSTDRGFTLVNGGANAPTIFVLDSRTIGFSGLVTSPDDAGLTKTGLGTLVLSNDANDYVGITTVSGGTLSVDTLANGGIASGIGGASSDSANLVLSDGGRLQYTGGTVDIDRGFTLAAGDGGIGVEQAATTLTISGTAVGTGRVVKDGAGKLILSGANSYTGGTLVNAGTLIAGSATAFGGEEDGTNAGILNVSTGATVDLANNSVFVGGLSGAGTVLLGSATLNINALETFSGTGGISVTRSTQTMLGCNNDYTGVTSITSTLSVNCLADGGEASGIGAASSDPANLLIGGTLEYSGGSVIIDRGFTTAGGQIVVREATTTLELTGATTGAGFIKDGAGTLVLSGASTRTGTTQIDNGTLRAGTINAFGSGRINFANTAGATVDLAGYDTTVGYLTGGGPIGGNITLGTATLTLNWASGSADFAGAISGSGGLIKNGGVNQIFTGCNSSYTGSTVINGGGLTVSCLTDGGANSSIGASTADASNLVINGGTLGYIGAGGSTNRQFTLGASGGNALDASGAGAITFASEAALTFSGTDTAQTLTLTGTNAGDNVFAAEITDNGAGVTSLAKTGTGTWILTNPDSSYTGSTTILGGVLGVDKLSDGGVASSIGASSADASNLVIGNNSTLRYTGDGDTTNRLFTLAAGTAFIESSGTGAVVFTDTGPVTLAGNNLARTIALGGTNTGDNTLAGSISDAGTGKTILAKNDAGTWVLTGNNSYTGSTVINDGTLKIGGGGTTGSIVSDTINLGTLAFDRSDEYIYDGVISDVGNVEQLGGGTTILTGNSTYTGGTTINDGTLQLGNGGASGSIVGNVTDNGELAFNRSDSYTFAGLISGTGTVSQIGAGTTILTADNSYTGGTTISDGTLQLGNGGTTGNIAGDVVNDGVLAFNRSGSHAFAGVISGSGAVEQNGTGNTILTGTNTYTGGTTITDGILIVGDGTTNGSIVGDVTNNGTLSFNRSDDISFAGTITGSGGDLVKLGAGNLTLTGDNGYTGQTSVQFGGLYINGDQSAATGQTSIASGATLGGNGIVGGNVVMIGTSTLAAGNNDVGTLTINGNLGLSSGTQLNYEFGEADVAGGLLNDLVDVGGNLVLDGTINVSVPTGGAFDAGIYRVFNYGGTLIDNGLDLGTLPSGSDVTVQTSVAGQVNLVNAAGLLLNFWDGDAGPKFNSVVDGGDGTWQNSTGNNNWTGSTGAINAGYADGGFAIFAGTGGTVTVDNGLGAVSASGMQFASDGYTITGNPLTLIGPQSIIRVGDGTAAGADMTATIASELIGTTQLVKADLGTLVLTGTNSYTGGTLIDEGTLSISADTNLGDAAGAITINNGTLQTTADLATSRAITLDGAGTLLLTGANTYADGTTISAGTLQLGNGGTAGSITGDVANNGTLAINRSDTLTLAGVISGTGALSQLGTGTTILTGNNSYTGGTTITAGTLQIGDGSTTGSIAGDVANNGTLAFNRADDVTFAGVISGSGNVVQNGTGTTDLTGISTYTGDTIANAGELRLADGGQITSTLRILAGSNSGESGVITVDGAGSSLTITGSLVAPSIVGDNGTGTLNITDGGVVTGGMIRLGNGATGQGMLNVSGEGSSYTTTIPGTSGSSIWRIGGRGEGIVNVTAGGDIQNSGDIWFGAFAGGEGTATISGTGSTWDIGGALRLVNGSMSVLDGGVVHADSADIGYTPLVFGDTNVLVSGAGSRLETTADFRLNAASGHSGVLTIADGGTVAPGSGTLAITGGNAALNIGGAEGAAATAAGTLDADSVTMAAATNRVNFNHADTAYLFDAAISGAGAVNQTGSGTTILTAGNSYTGGTTITDGALQLGNGGTTGSIAGDVANDGTLIFNRSDDVTFAGLISGTGDVEQGGAGMTVLTADNSYTGGTTISAGTLQLGNGGTTGSIVGDVANEGVLVFNRSDSVTFGGAISGTGAVNQLGTGATILTGDSSYTGGTTITAGTLQLGDGGTSGSIVGDVVNEGVFAFNRSDELTLAGLISGAGVVNQNGAGTTILSGVNTYAGATNVNAGTLIINGDQSGATGLTTVNTGGTLGGIGMIGGNVIVADGGAINPGDVGAAPGALGIVGNLDLAANSTLNFNFGQANVPGGPLNDLINVGGDLVLDGTLNVQTSGGGSFDPGVYRVINYAGGITNNGLDLGTIPSPDFYVQTSIPGQVNLVNTSGLTLRYWDGDTIASKNNNLIEGGNGLWQNLTGNDNWTEETGALNAPFTDAAFAVFMGAAGTVTVDDSLGAINASGMQFLTDGYVIEGAAINLVGTPTSVIRVGDGTAAGADMTATIASDLLGTSELVKSDLGALILTGANSYTGGTSVNAGTLFVNGDQSGATGLTNVASGAMLGGTGVIGGDVALADNATLAAGTNGVGTLTINGGLSLSSGTQLNYEFGQADIAGGALNDLVNVGGNLVLDGTINVSVPTGGAFDAGIYRVFNYGGTLTDNGLDLGTLPSGSTVAVQTSVTGQVNLVNSAGLTLNFWDGDAGPKFNSVVDGGNGTWQNSTGNNNWTEASGTINAGYTDAGFAIFAGMGGTVTVDNGLGVVSASGMQFASDGYTITGNPLTLVGPQSIIRVGDGTAAGADMTATIASELTGTTQLVKTDAGTLVLSGANSYTGGTLIDEGTLSIASDANLGDAAGAITINTGTLQTTADLASDRAFTLDGAGTLLTDANTSFTLNGVVGGPGSLTKSGTGALVLTADSSAFAGSTTVQSGTLVINGILAGAMDVQTAGRLEGTGMVGTTVNNGMIAPGHGGIGTLTINGDYMGAGGALEIETALGGDNSPTDLLVVNGSTAGSTQVNVINRDGLGAQTIEGIKIVDVAGVSDGTFALNGDYVFHGDQAVVAGAYGYRLYKNGITNTADGDWYLRSNLLNEPTDPQTPNTPSISPACRSMRPMARRCRRSTACRRSSSVLATGAGRPPPWAAQPASGAVWKPIAIDRTRSFRRAGRTSASTAGRCRSVSTGRSASGPTAPCWSAASPPIMATPMAMSALCSATAASIPRATVLAPRSPGMVRRASMPTGRRS